jgi:hypothetical protein
VGPDPQPAAEIPVLVIGPREMQTTVAACGALDDLLDRSHSRVVSCDVGALGPSLEAVGLVARLHLTALRKGAVVRLDATAPALGELLALLGLDLPVQRSPSTDGGLQPKHREEIGLDEGVHAGDLPGGGFDHLDSEGLLRRPFLG